MKHSLINLSIAAVLAGLPMGVAFAANPHTGGTTGQPNQSCEEIAAMFPDANVRPGNSLASNGTFNPGGTAAQNYAGNGPHGPPSDVNGAAHAVSQYDVACFQQSQKLP